MFRFMKVVLRIPQKNILMLGISAFFIAGIVSPAYLPMPMNDDGTMANCPYLGITALCTMQPLEHVVALQSMLAALPVKTVGFFIAIILFAFAVFLMLLNHLNGGVLGHPTFLHKSRHRLTISIFDALRE